MKNKKHILTVTKVILLVVLAYISFKLAFPITNSLVKIERGPELMIGILFSGSIWVLAYMTIGVAVTSISWSILVYFLDRCLLAKEVKQNLAKQEKLYFKKKSFFSYVSIAAGGTSVIVFLVISLFVLFAIYQTPKSIGKSRLLSAPIMSFTKRNSVKIYEDKRVSFYMNELQSSTRKLVNANVNYSIFKYDVHRKMAGYCLRLVYSDIEGKVTLEPQKIQENILNNYVTRNNLERQASNNLYYVRNTLISHDSYGVRKLDEKYPNRCENFMTVDEMYQLRIPSYLIEIKELPKRFKSDKKRKILELITMIQENFNSMKK